MLQQPAFRFRCLLYGMYSPPPSRGWPGPVTFEANIVVGLVYSHNRNAERMPATFFKLDDLIAKIVDDSVYLFNHCFGENLHFNPNFNRSDFSTCNRIAFVPNRRFAGNGFPQSSIATP